MLSQEILDLYKKSRLMTYRAMFGRIREKTGSLSATEAYAVDVIYLLGSPTITQLAETLGISQPNATYKVNNLVAKGYACKTISEDDKRECRVTVGERFYKYYGNSTRFIDNAVDALREDYSEDELADIRGRKIGFIFQQFNLLPKLTAQENVELPLIYQGMSASKRHARSEEVLKRVGLLDRMDHKPTELSGGQQQRVAIARALAGHPSLLLADEPTGNLDSRTGADVMRLFHELHEAGNTIVLITSNLGARFLAGQSAPLGFAAGSEAVFEKQAAQAVEEAKKWFRPELVGRLDELIVFRPLSDESMSAIAEKMLCRLEVRAARSGYQLRHTPQVGAVLAARARSAYGARELRRQVDRAVEQALADQIAAGTACTGQHWTADCTAEGTIVLRQDETATL